MSQQTEDRLRSALRAEAEGLRLSSDRWQENQRRVFQARSGRNRKVLTVAAAGLAVATLLGATALLGGDADRQRGDTPASDTGDPFTPEYLLGAPVEAETLTLDGRPTVHTIALSDMTGGGPRLCGRYAPAGTNGSGGADSISSSTCNAREPDADDDSVAVDWLVGNQGGGGIRGVTAAVDERVAKVRIWMDNGDMLLATLYPTGWDNTRMFALTTQPPDAPTAQRLVAYGRDGNVLQAVDLLTPFGTSWLPQRSACDGDRVADLVPNGDVLPNAYVALGTVDASISVRTAVDDGGNACLERLTPDSLAGWYPGGLGLVATVVAPEVARVRLVVGEKVVDEVKASSVSGSPWRVAILKAADVDQLDRAELIALDTQSLELDRQPAGQLGSATP